MCTLPDDIANNFNLYFVQSILDINRSIPDCIRNDPVQSTSEWSNFTLIDGQKLMTHIKNIKKKSGIYNVNIDVINKALLLIKTCLLNMINYSFTHGICPPNWRKTMITPIQKVPGTTKAEEFRPINTIFITDKLTEKIVAEQLKMYLEQNDIISDRQSGFREDYSCETAINFILERWKSAIENNRIVVAIFFDLKRAFETIDRQVLLETMKCYGIKGNVLEWFRSWLTDRTQKVFFKTAVSMERGIDIGTPQGTPLSCSLFNIYINPLLSIPLKGDLHVFADDTLYWYEFDRQETFTVSESIRTDLNTVIDFLNSHKLKLNVQKTKAMLLHRSTYVNDSVTQLLNDYEIEIVNEIKYLGVIIDSGLNFNKHFDFLFNKISKKVGFLCRQKNAIGQNTKTLMLKTLILSHIDYCSTIIILFNETQTRKLQVLMNRSMRAILNCGYRTSVDYMLNKLKLLDIKQRVVFNTLCMVYKIKNDELPPYLSQFLIPKQRAKPYNLRTNELFRLPSVSTSHRQNSLFYNGVKIYNDMVSTMDDSTDLKRFKANAEKYVLEKFTSH